MIHKQVIDDGNEGTAQALDGDEMARIETSITAEVDSEIHVQEEAGPMALKSLVEDTYADVPMHLRRQYNRFIEVVERYGEARQGDGAFPL